MMTLTFLFLSERLRVGTVVSERETKNLIGVDYNLGRSQPQRVDKTNEFAVCLYFG